MPYKQLIKMKTILPFFILYVNLHAQICDENLKPVEDSLVAYQQRETRCEGFYESKIATPDIIELISFTRGSLVYNLSRTDTIKITPQTMRDRRITLQAKAIPLRTYYRMDAIIDSDSTLEWPVADVLYKGEMSSDMIGVTGSYENQYNVRIFIPLKAKSREQPTGDNDDLYVVLRPTIDLDGVYYSIFSYQDSTATDYEALSDHSAPAGATITIFPKLETAGYYRLNLLFKIPTAEEEEEDEKDEDDWENERFFILLY